MGPFGSGKTTGWLNVAKWAEATGSPSRFYVIDTDNALDAMLDTNSQYQHLDYRRDGNVEWVAAYEWLDYKAAIANFQQKLGPDDWLVVDFIGPAWDAVQAYYIAQIYETDSAEYFLDLRRNKAGGQALDGWKDWQYINRLYKEFINDVLYKTAGHKFLTAMPANLHDADDKGLKATFGAYGVKPKGQKELGYQTHTVLLTSIDRAGRVGITTIKDRERDRVIDQEVTEFTLDYLVKVGGWTL